MDLDKQYIGMSLDIPSWDVLVLAPHLIKKMHGLFQTDWAQDTMQESGYWGMILKLGERAFEQERFYESDGKTKRATPIAAPYAAGDWIMFNEFCPQSRRINKTNVYAIPDAKIMFKIPENELHLWNVYHLIRDELENMKKDTKDLVSELERKAAAWTSTN